MLSSVRRSNRQKHIVGIHYVLGNKIGEGSFGVIFEGENILNENHKEPVAIKFEPRNSETPQLRDEFRAYRILNGCLGIPHAYYYGQEGMHNVLVIDLLGPSLEDLFEWCGRKFSVKTTCLIAKQMIQRIREIHEHDLIYRDIKPDNFLISQYQLISKESKCITKNAHDDPNLIYMVDFGMAKQYRDPRTKHHIPYREKKSLSGTARYMSINTHFGKEQSRRDDLESIGHVLFYFLRGSLPWQGLKAPNSKLKYEKIGHTKQKIPPNELLMNNSIPRQFAMFLSYSRGLKFNEEPDYKYLIGLIDEVMVENKIVDDGHYDWMELNDGKGWDIRVNKRTNLHGYGNPTPRNTNTNKARFNMDSRKGSNSPYDRTVINKGTNMYKNNNCTSTPTPTDSNIISSNNNYNYSHNHSHNLNPNPNVDSLYNNKYKSTSYIQDTPSKMINNNNNNNSNNNSGTSRNSKNSQQQQRIITNSSNRNYNSIESPNDILFKKGNNYRSNHPLNNQRYDSDNYYVTNDDSDSNNDNDNNNNDDDFTRINGNRRHCCNLLLCCFGN